MSDLRRVVLIYDDISWLCAVLENWRDRCLFEAQGAAKYDAKRTARLAAARCRRLQEKLKTAEEVVP